MSTLKRNKVSILKNRRQRTIIRHQYGDWYVINMVSCYICCMIWYSEERPRWAVALPSPLVAVLNVTAHPSTASVPTSYHLM